MAASDPDSSPTPGENAGVTRSHPPRDPAPILLDHITQRSCPTRRSCRRCWAGLHRRKFPRPGRDGRGLQRAADAAEAAGRDQDPREAREAGDDFAFEERFKREAYAMAALTHPNIVQVYDCGDAGENFSFISMELVDGGDLERCDQGGQDDARGRARSSSLKSATDSRRRMSAASCIATSSPRTSSSRRTASPRWRTSGWRRSST